MSGSAGAIAPRRAPAASFRVRVLALVGLVAVFASGAPCPKKPPLRARQVTEATAAADLIGGTEATGGVGDWVLTNGIVTAIVDNVGYQEDIEAATGQRIPTQSALGATGGGLIDLGGFGRDDDGLAIAVPVVGLAGTSAFYAFPAGEALGDPNLPAIVAEADRAAGVASLTVHGRVMVLFGVAPLQQPIHFRHIYSLRAGERFLRIRTEIQSFHPFPLPIYGIGDAFLLGRGGTMAFVPHPERGFHLTGAQVPVPFVTQFGLVGPEHGPVGDGGSPVNEISYTLAAPGTGLFDVSTEAILLAGRPLATTPLPAFGTMVHERRIYVGRRNDVASSAELALRDLGPELGFETGQVIGRLVAADGFPFRASVEVKLLDLDPETPGAETLHSRQGGDATPQPLSQTSTDDGADGRFELVLPAGRYGARVLVEERDGIEDVVFDVEPGAVTDLGELALSSTGMLAFTVTDTATGEPIPARLTIKGAGRPDPILGIPVDQISDGAPLRVPSRGPLPYGNLVFTATGSGSVALRPGAYRVIATRGFEWDATWRDVQIGAGATASIALALERQVDTTGWLAADFHVHASPSADSSVPPRDRLATLVAEGVEVVVAADHDFIFDYGPVIEAEDLGHAVASMAGTEVSSSRSPPPFTSGVGHFNGWPLTVDLAARRNGAPEDESVPPSVIIDRLRARGAEVVQLNHPLWGPLGLLASLAYDPLLPLGAPPNDYLLETSPLGTGTRNLDFDAIEIHNGNSTTLYETQRDVWMSFLQQGERITATGASDTHRVAFEVPGSPRSYVAHDPDDPAAFDAGAFNAALREMRAIGSSGPFLEATLSSATETVGLGETLVSTDGAPLALRVRVQAPCWIPVGFVRVFENGLLLADIPIDGAPCTGPVRFDDDVTVVPAEDSVYVVEAVERLPRASASFEQQLVTYVLRGNVLRAFANPIYVDTDGNGVFDPPGL